MKRLISYLLILPLFATTALLSGCKNSLDELMDIPYDSTKSISFATEMDMATRATPINNASELTSMGVFCAATGLDDWNGTATLNKMFNEQLNNTSGTWTYQNSNIYWGAANITDRYSFFAYTPHASLNNGITVNGSSSTQGKPTLTYIVPTDVSKQPNLMLAVPRYNIRPTSGNIALRMKHALTCIGFQIMGDEEQLTAISILGVAVSGDVVMDGGINVVWTNLGVPTNTDFSASINYDSGENYFTVPSTMTNLIASDGYLMMIPQVLGIDAKIKLSFNDGSTKYISLNTFIWEAGKRITYNITLIPDGTITVTPNEVWLPYTLLNPALHLHVICQKNNGDPAPTMPWTLTSADPSWCLLSVASTDDFNAASASVSGTGTTLIHLLALENQSTNPRQTDIYLGASPLDVVSIVTQWGNFGPITDNAGGGTPPLGVNTYVGAFWRANQIGERIIRIEAGANSANYGKWTAAVRWMDPRWGIGDGIVLSMDDLDTSSLLDRGISFTSDMNPDAYGSPEDYPVIGCMTTVNGEVSATNKSMVFRIGLKSAYNPTANYPARYAVVLLSYANNTKHQKIFLRQGEGDDYLMLNSDPISTGGLSVRTACRKISPYNLTAPTLDARVDAPGTVPAVNPGTFTDYPTQSGALFLWASPLTQFDGSGRWANNPHTSVASSWNGGYALTYWNTLAATIEACPPGYHRPNDGSMSGDENSGSIANSEIRQSLFWRPVTSQNYTNDLSNSLVGYYADGFFDRRRTVNGLGSGANNTTVASGTRNIAHIGRLFFNPIESSDHYNASLFFPFGGVRNATLGGQLVNTGTDGGYWTSTATAYAQTDALYLRFQTTFHAAAMWRAPKNLGYTIRCFKD